MLVSYINKKINMRCFSRTRASLPVPPATSSSRAPGCGFMTCSSVSFHSRWIPRLMASFIRSYFWATFSNTLYTEKAKWKRESICSSGKGLVLCFYSAVSRTYWDILLHSGLHAPMHLRCFVFFILTPLCFVWHLCQFYTQALEKHGFILIFFQLKLQWT